jgi:hypothetical protein
MWYRKFVPAQLQVSDEEDEAVGGGQVQKLLVRASPPVLSISLWIRTLNV